jgi:hypothetical protein
MADWATLEVESAPGQAGRDDPDNLLGGPAGATTSILEYAPLEARDHDDAQDWGDPDEDTPVPTLIAGGEPVQLDPEAVIEAAVWKSDLHPRWPKGTPERGGEFMRVGEHFMSGGHEWEIAHIVHGHVIAHRAGGKVSTMGEHVFKVEPHPEGGGTHLPGVERVVAPIPTGSKSESGTVTVISPYVDSSTHDPSIPLPASSELSATEWQRFGHADQLVYTELMERFGTYKPGVAQKLVDEAYSKATQQVQNMVRNAYDSQYGSSTGKTLSLAKDQITTSDAELRTSAIALLAEHAAAVQWDLYNRTRSPDITLTHKSDNDQSWWKQKIAKKKAIFSALSQAWAYKHGSFGGHGMVTPFAIRHITMSTQSAHAGTGVKFLGEKEVSSPYRWVPDERSIPISDNGPQSKGLSWLAGATTVPVGGHIADALRDSLKNGTYLPPVAQPPNVTMDGASGKTWVDPPAKAADPQFGPGAKLPTTYDHLIAPSDLPKGVPWHKVDKDGNPVAQTGEEASAHVGQYFLGMKGTLYWIGPDPGAKGGYPFHIFKAENGTFTSEDFGYDATKPGYYIDKDFDLGDYLEKQNKAPGFTPSDWAESSDAKFVEEMSPGEKFKLNGTAYEVLGEPVNGQVPVIDMESGLKGKINGTYKTNYLIAADGSDHPAPSLDAPMFADGDWVQTPFGKARVTGVEEMPHAAQLVQVTHVSGIKGATEFPSNELSHWTPLVSGKPTVGTTFPYKGKKATVTKLLANGEIQLNLKPGKVKITEVEFAELHAHEAIPVHKYAIDQRKMKLGKMSVGDVFHASAGNQTLRPYQVVHNDEAAKIVHVQNLDTGKVEQMSKGVSYRRLLPQASSADVPPAEMPKGAPVKATGGNHVGPAWDPAKFEPGEKLTVQNMTVGTYFADTEGNINQKVEDTPTHSMGELLSNATTTLIAHGAQTTPLKTYKPIASADAPISAMLDVDDPGSGQHSQATPFDPSSYIEGEKVKIGELEPGTMFKTEGKNGVSYYQLSDDGKHTTNLITGKVYDAKPKWSATPLVAPPSETAQPAPKPEPGTVGALKVGDEFTVPEGYAGEGSKYEVVDATPKFMPGLDVHTIDAKPMFSNNVEHFAMGLKLDEAAPPVEVEGTELDSKVTKETPYEHLTKGDTAKLGALKAGDQLKLTNEPTTVYQVVKPASHVKGTDEYAEGNAEIKRVLPNGNLSNVTLADGWHFDLPVKLHAKAEDVVPKVVPDDGETLPQAEQHGKLVGFEKPSSGPYVFSQIALLPNGAVFEDATGKKWMVKQTGAKPIISNSLHNYEVADPSLLVADTAQDAYPAQIGSFHDWAPPVVGEQHSPDFVAAKGDLVPNGAHTPLGELTLKQGDYVQINGYVLKIEPSQNEYVKAEEVETGQQFLLSKAQVPEMISPGHVVQPQVVPEEKAPAPTLYTYPMTLADLPVGAHYTVAPGSSNVLTKWHPGASSPAKVYAQEPSVSGGAPLPKAVDPAVQPPVKGPADFAPNEPEPVVNGDVQPDVLQPFASRKGPGGVYSHPRLHETQPGQMFTDKSGEDYRVISHGAAKTIYEHVGSGKQHSTASTNRVKATALPPDPGPHLKPIVAELTAKYGSLENVPKMEVADAPTSATGTGGKATNPRLGHLNYGEVAVDGQGHAMIFLGSWLNRALVLDYKGEPRLADAAARVTLADKGAAVTPPST